MNLKGSTKAERCTSSHRIGTLYDTKIDASKVHDSGIDLLVAMVGLDSGELRYVRYDRSASESAGVPSGNLLSRDDLTSSLAVVSMRDAVLGSAADPIFLAAQEVAGDLYVDGGVREIAPLRAALQMGATRVFTVLCDVPMTPEDRGKHTDIGGIGLRCLSLAVDEVELGDLEPEWPTPYRGWTIRPGFQVHDGFTIDAALIRIDLDHGFMAGFDAVDGRVRSARRRTLLQDRSARIAALRVQCKQFEAHVDISGVPHSYVTVADALPQLQSWKSQIRQLMESRLRLGGQYANPARSSRVAVTIWSVCGTTGIEPVALLRHQGQRQGRRLGEPNRYKNPEAQNPTSAQEMVTKSAGCLPHRLPSWRPSRPPARSSVWRLGREASLKDFLERLRTAPESKDGLRVFLSNPELLNLYWDKVGDFRVGVTSTNS